ASRSLSSNARRRLPTRRNASPASSSIRSSERSVSSIKRRARSSPSSRRASSYGAAAPRSAKPPLRPLAPPATSRSSYTRTRTPCSARVSAHEHPVTPPPITTTSARPSKRARGRPPCVSFCQNEVVLTTRSYVQSLGDRWGGPESSLPRKSDEWKRFSRGRSAVERELGRLKHHYGLAILRVRG